MKSYRSQHRQRSHDASHAQASGPAPPILHHPLVPAGEPTVIADQNGFESLVAEIRTKGLCAYDTEFIGEQSYYPKLCVVQLATADRIALVDALAELDLRPLWELMADPDVEKVVHAGQQDVEPVQRNLGKPARNVFDTQIAAAFIGLNYPTAMGKLVHQLLSADVGPGVKFSAWDRRPLSNAQLQYAANDVRYLLLLRHVIGERLERAGTAAWARLECDAICRSEGSDDQASPLQAVSVKGASRLKPRQRVALSMLAQWREEAARVIDMPPRSLLKDPLLVQLAISNVRQVSDLNLIRGLPRPIKSQFGQQIVELCTQAMTAEAQGLATSGSRSPRYDYSRDRPLVQRTWECVVQIAQMRFIAPNIVTSKKEIAQAIRQLRENGLLEGAQSAGETKDSLDLGRIGQGWRSELLGSIRELALRD